MSSFRVLRVSCRGLARCVTGQEKGRRGRSENGSTWGARAGWQTGSTRSTLWYVRTKTGHAPIGAWQWVPQEHIEDPVKSLVMGLPY
jgi:hypothetical protein